MLDRFGRKITYLRMSVTEQCNLRCRYCMPAGADCEDSCMGTGAGEILTPDEMITAVRAAASLGITKVRITGGEPLVRHDIISVCERTTTVEEIAEVCITTNGLLLEKYAKELAGAGVKHINVSLDTLDAEKYAYMTRSADRYAKNDSDAKGDNGAKTDYGAKAGDCAKNDNDIRYDSKKDIHVLSLNGPEKVLEGVEAALSAGFEKVKINSVLINNFNTDEIGALAELTRRYPVDVRFIELMPMISGAFGPEAYIKAEEVLKRLPELEKAEDDGVAKMYRLPGAKGGIGLISPVSAHFCAECNRLRLTADGRIKPCLHSKEEYSVKGLDEAGMRKVMENAIMAKPEKHPKLAFDSLSEAGRSMNRIGG